MLPRCPCDVLPVSPPRSLSLSLCLALSVVPLVVAGAAAAWAKLNVEFWCSLIAIAHLHTCFRRYVTRCSCAFNPTKSRNINSQTSDIGPVDVARQRGQWNGRRRMTTATCDARQALVKVKSSGEAPQAAAVGGKLVCVTCAACRIPCLASTPLVCSSPCCGLPLSTMKMTFTWTYSNFCVCNSYAAWPNKK